MDILSFGIIGAAVSLLVQYLKKKFGTATTGTYLVIIAVSVIAGTIYYLLKDTEIWTAILAILGFAGAIHNYILRRFEE